ncbi:hypothetical protein Tco_1036701 [Tanacetum coccineum]
MATEVDKCFVERMYFEIENKELFIENDRLLEHIIYQDVMCIAIHADIDNKRMYKLDLEPLSPKLRKNREAHVDYLKKAKEHADTLHDIVEQARVVQIILWYLDSGCSKHMTRQCSLLINFVSKFMGTVRFRNDHVAAIMGYGDY